MCAPTGLGYSRWAKAHNPFWEGTSDEWDGVRLLSDQSVMAREVSFYYLSRQRGRLVLEVLLRLLLLLLRHPFQPRLIHSFSQALPGPSSSDVLAGHDTQELRAVLWLSCMIAIALLIGTS